MGKRRKRKLPWFKVPPPDLRGGKRRAVTANVLMQLDPRAEAALDFARQVLRWFHEGGNPWSFGSPFDREAGQGHARSLMQTFVLNGTAETRRTIVGLAKIGEPDAALVLQKILLEMESHGIEPTTELSDYRMHLVANAGRALPKLPGAKPKEKFVRRLVIALTVGLVADRHELHVHKRSGKHAAASEIVSVALQEELKISLGYKMVEETYDRFRPGLPYWPGWSRSFVPF